MSFPTRHHLVNVFYALRDPAKFSAGIQQALDQVQYGGAFVGDNLLTFGKSLSFLHDEAFMAAFNAQTSDDPQEQAAIWRLHTLAWAAKRALKIPGDLVECACYRGTSARVIADYIALGKTDKRYWLYDLFDHPESATALKMPSHGKDLFAEVRARFADLSNVTVTQGRVPDILDGVAPERIAFLHLDINDAAAEIGALERLFDRVSPGGSIVFDDYGWFGYHQQKLAEDAFFAERGYSVLELPTGQGLVIK